MADTPTASKTLTDEYQLLIAGACMVTLEEGLSVKVRFDSSLPAADADFHELTTANSPVSYSGRLNVYARRNFERSGVTRTIVSYTGV